MKSSKKLKVKRRLNKNLMVRALKKLSQRTGSLATKLYFCAELKMSTTQLDSLLVKNGIKDYADLCRNAGLAPARMTIRFSESEVVEFARSLSWRLNRIPTLNDFQVAYKEAMQLDRQARVPSKGMVRKVAAILRASDPESSPLETLWANARAVCVARGELDHPLLVCAQRRSPKKTAPVRCPAFEQIAWRLGIPNPSNEAEMYPVAIRICRETYQRLVQINPQGTDMMVADFSGSEKRMVELKFSAFHLFSGGQALYPGMEVWIWRDLDRLTPAEWEVLNEAKTTVFDLSEAGRMLLRD